MDNFIDKLAQKFIAGEVIKANSVAEERELKRLREQVAEYEQCLQEMKKLQMTNTRTAAQLREMMEEQRESVKKLTEESIRKLEQIKEEETKKDKAYGDTLEAAQKNMEELMLSMKQQWENLEKNHKEIEKWFQKADDYLHKENVKVYRNVQAVIVEETGKKSEEIIKAQEAAGKKYSKPVLILLGLTLAASLGNIILTLCIKYGMF
ncbi:MAG: hypothetical protein IKL51_03195 [Lachnospiraceae bacterium]|nr:hypothetical protein [Lachnospiraceae bacterium]